MDFLDHLRDYMDVEIYYKKLNNLSNIDYKNIINYLNIQWNKIKYEINDEYYNTISIGKIYKCNIDTFTNIMKKFINNNYTLGIFFINSLIRYI